MKMLSTKVIKQRSRVASAFFESYTSYESFIGETQRVLVTEISADGKHFIAHNKMYHQILLKNDRDWIGQSVDVEIISVSKWHLVGRVIDGSTRDAHAILQHRVPKLVRVQGKVITVDSSETCAPGSRADGAQFSAGAIMEPQTDKSEHISRTTVNYRRLIQYAIAGACISMLPVRRTVQAGLLVMLSIAFTRKSGSG